MTEKEFREFTKKRLVERYELALKQSNRNIRRTKQILELEEKYNISFKFKRIYFECDVWICVVYFVEYENEIYHVVSYKGARNSLEDRVYKALYEKGPVGSKC